MNRSSYYALNSLLIMLCLFSTYSHGSLSAVKATSNKSHLLSNAQNVVTLNWQVATTAGHTQGAGSSVPAEIFDPASSNLLLTLGGSFNQSGAGPFMFTETLTITARTVQNWLDSGIQRVVLRRTFEEVGPTRIPVSGEIAFTLSSSSLSLSRDGAGELIIQSLQIALQDANDKPNNSIKLVELNGALQPQLSIAYAGTGLLEGSWQIAEPASTQGKPLFRTLSMVRKPLLKSQQTQLSGPVLPTNRPGKYLLRFCVSGQNQTDSAAFDDINCTNTALSVQAVYQVMPNAIPIKMLKIHSPLTQSISASSEFSWEPSPGAVLYKIDIIRNVNQQMQLVTGLLLPNHYTRTALSELMQSKLESGMDYSWQISSINEAGNVIGQSKRYQFTYQP